METLVSYLTDAWKYYRKSSSCSFNTEVVVDFKDLEHYLPTTCIFWLTTTGVGIVKVVPFP